jgi:Zn-dependent peptidase ImmA (M78 family)
VTTDQQLAAMLESKRERHPELRAPLAWPTLMSVCEREGVAISYGPLPCDAMLLARLGSAVIVLNSELHPRQHTYRAAHELAHWWLHGDREAAFYTMRDPVAHDAREDEAEYMALRLMQGW